MYLKKVGGKLNDKRTGGRWSTEETNLHINVLELQAILFALKSLCKDIRNVHIRIETDNTTTVCYVNNMGVSRSRACNDIARQIWLWVLDHSVLLTAAHLLGKDNIVADEESRSLNHMTITECCVLGDKQPLGAI